MVGPYGTQRGRPPSQFPKHDDAGGPRLRVGHHVQFSYNHAEVDEFTGPKFKEVFILNPNWKGKAHGIDLKRITEAEREVLWTVFDPKNMDIKGEHRIPLVNDILRRMDPRKEVRNPIHFYHIFVKQFLRGKDAYRQYWVNRISNVRTVSRLDIRKIYNPKPLFHKVASKPGEKRPSPGTQAGLERGKKPATSLSRADAERIAAQMGVKLSKDFGVKKAEPPKVQKGPQRLELIQKAAQKAKKKNK